MNTKARRPRQGSRSISFERNLQLLSGVTETERMRGMWEVKDFGRSTKSKRCQLCGQTILRSAVITRTDDQDNRAVIGTDCAQKLNLFNQTGDIVAIHPQDVRRYSAVQRQIIQDLIKPLMVKTSVASIMAWLDQQVFDSLPVTVQTAYRWLKSVKHVPSQEHAVALVEYYKRNRPFVLADIVLGEERELFNLYRNYLQLKPTVTLAELPAVRAQLAAAETDVQENWQRVSLQLRKGIASRLLANFTVEYGGLSWRHERFAIQVPVAYAEFIESPYLEACMPASLSFGTVRGFDPRYQKAIVELDADCQERWFGKARKLRESKLCEARERAEQEAAKKEQARVARLMQLVQQPIDVSTIDLLASQGENPQQVRVYFFTEEARIEAVIADAMVGHKLYLETKPEVLQGEVLWVDDGHKWVKLELDAVLVTAWRERAHDLFASKRAQNHVRMESMIGHYLANGGLRRLSFVAELNKKLDCEQCVQRVDGMSFFLSYDDAYSPSEGEVLVWLDKKFAVMSRAWLVRRVKVVENPDGSVELVYQMRPTRYGKPVVVPVASAR